MLNTEKLEQELITLKSQTRPYNPNFFAMPAYS